MSSSLLQLAVGSHNLSQAEKKIIVVASWATHKMTLIFTQNNNFSPKTILCELTQLVTTVISLSAWDKSCEARANSRILDNM